uniref:Uncharacterized protein n=1 Tax=Vitis vinifera TaxID=29760 RepID=A5BFK3_VITVI|nr:hypothetical protein VITISV_034431 [Vitis vinifera]
MNWAFVDKKILISSSYHQIDRKINKFLKRYKALRPCAVRRHLGASELLLGAIRPWHCAHGFINWLTAQGLGALVLVRGGDRPHQVPCRCGHGVHTTHVVEPMCVCSSRVVRARSPSGAHAVHVWLARTARLVHSRCASSSPAVCVWLAHSARLARPWCVRGARLARPRPPPMAPGV